MDLSELMKNDEFALLDMQRQLHVKQLQIESLLEVTKSINNNLKIESLFSIYEFILSSQLGVREFVLYLHNDVIWERKLLFGFNEEYFVDIIFSQSILNIKSNKVLKNERFGIPNPFEVIVPVYHKEKPLAFLLIGDVNIFDNDSLEEKLKFIQTITNVIVVAIENKRLFKNTLEAEKISREMQLAAKMQTSLIPKDLPNNNEVKLAGVYKPHRSIGGDYYDCIRLNKEGKYIFCIADISGKGAPAALLMANFQAVLRTLVIEKNDLVSLVTSLNKRVVDISNGEKFITLFIGLYCPQTRKLEYINAGHNPSILYDNKEVKFLESGCTILGIFDDLPSIQVGEVTVPENAILINYTDGLTDTLNDQKHFFDTDKLVYFIQKNHHLKVKAFNDALINFVEIFKGAQEYSDDISILTCRFTS